jgi:hypothetical protein
MIHFIDYDPPCLGEEIGEQVWKYAINRRIQVYLKE